MPRSIVQNGKTYIEVPKRGRYVYVFDKGKVVAVNMSNTSWTRIVFDKPKNTLKLFGTLLYDAFKAIHGKEENNNQKSGEENKPANSG